MIIFVLPQMVFADKLEVHKAAMSEYIKLLGQYELRLEKLREKKDKAVEGPELDDILTDIATLHKDILNVRHKKTLLFEHLQKMHAGEDLISEIEILRQEKAAKVPEKEKGNKGKMMDDAFDKRLDGLISRVQTQYARTIKDRPAPNSKKATAKSLSESMIEDKPKKMKPTEQLEKDEYLKEKTKAVIKVE